MRIKIAILTRNPSVDNSYSWGPTLQCASGRKVLTSPAVPDITSVGALVPRELCTFAGDSLPTIR